MRCVADVHYDVVRRGFEYGGEISGLACKFCDFYVSKLDTQQSRSSKSGLGRYNRMRGRMVAHLHAEHRDQLMERRAKP